jgi:hypothetical protein
VVQEERAIATCNSTPSLTVLHCAVLFDLTVQHYFEGMAKERASCGHHAENYWQNFKTAAAEKERKKN